MKNQLQSISAFAFPAAALTSITALALLAGGCGQPPSSASSAAGAHHLYVGLDTSGSWRPYLGVSASLCAQQAVGLNPDRDKLTLFRMDSSTREFSNGSAPESTEQIQQVIVAEVNSTSATRGTFPARFWAAAAERAESDSGPVTVEAFSDGDNDDLSAKSLSAMKAAARRLAVNPHVSGVYIFGAEPRNWAILRGEFAPLGNRLHLISPPELTADRVAAALP